MPALRIALRFGSLLALIALPAVGVGAGGAAVTGTQGTAVSVESFETTGPNLTVDAVARTSAPGLLSTHYYTIEIANTSDGEPLDSLRLDYSGTGVAVTDERALYQPTLVRDVRGENRTRVDLSNTTIAVTDHTIQVTFPDTYTLGPEDAVTVGITGLENPNASGTIDVDVSLNPERDGLHDTAAVDIAMPAPTISPQGVIGDSTRIGVHDPAGSRGFIVASDAEGSVIGTHALDPDQDLRMDIGIEAFVEDQHEQNGMTVRLVAYRDTNGNGEFDPTVDEPFEREGNPVGATVEHAVFQGGTTTTTPTTTTTTPPDPTSTTTAPTTSTPTMDDSGGDVGTASTTTATTTSLTGFHFGAGIIAVLGLALLARRR